MDTPTLTIVFEGGVTRSMPVALFERYPNSSFALAWGNTGNTNQINTVMKHMALEDFDVLMSAIQHGPKHYTKRARQLLDAHNFIDPIETKVARLKKSFGTALTTGVKPFTNGKTKLYWCTSMEQYNECAELFNDLSVFSVQVLTIGNHLYYASCGNIIHLIKVNRPHLMAGAGEWMPEDNEFRQVEDIIPTSIGYCNAIINCGKFLAQGSLDRSISPTYIGRKGYCCYCGTLSACECCEQLYRGYYEGTFSGRVDIITGMFGLTSMAIMQQLCHVVDPRPDDVIPLFIDWDEYLEDTEATLLRKLLCGIKWGEIPATKSEVLYSPGGIVKLSMHMGFVRL